MKISAFKIYIFFIIIIILGVFIIPKLSVKLNPSSSLRSITVAYNWSNASPYVLERDVTSVLEGGFSIIKGLKNLESRSSKGEGSINMEFDKRTDINIARFEVATIIRQLYKKLPDKVTYPTISVNRPDDEEQKAFLSYSINAQASSLDIQETVKTKIEPIIGSIKTIDKTLVYGANPIEYVLNYDPKFLQTLKITRQDLITAIENTFKKQALGEITYRKDYITLSIQPEAEGFGWHIPIKKIESRIVYLDELTTIKQKEQEVQSYYRINGKNAITLAIYATKEANTIRLAKTVDEALDIIKQKLPENYRIIKSYDSTTYLKKELAQIYERSFYTIIILLIFLLIISRSIKYLFLTVISLVTNITFAFLLYYVFQIEIQLYSLAGITISLGLIIDNSIVMIDHIRHQYNRNVFIPILASTLTTIGALSIIYFLDDEYRVNLIDFALVIIINLGVSLIIALVLIPALVEKIKLPLKKEKQSKRKVKEKFYRIYATIISFNLRFKRFFVIIIILIFGLPIFMLPQELESNMRWYEKAYNTTFGNEWYRANVRPHLDRYLGGTFRLFSYYVFDNAYYARNVETKLSVTASMEKGATVNQMNNVFIDLENYLSQFLEIKQYTTSINNVDNARLEITFKDKFSKTYFPEMLKSKLVKKVLDFGGIDWNINGVGEGFNYRDNTGESVNFSVKAKGYNYDALNVWADTLKIALLKHPRIQKVVIRENSYWAKKPSYEYRFKLNKERLTLASVSPKKLISQLNDLTLSKYEDIALSVNGKYSSFRFESNNAKSYDIWSIKNIPLDSLNKPILLKDIVEISKEREEESIYKENQEYIRLVEFQYTGSKKFGSKFLEEKLQEMRKKLPLGYRFENTEKLWLLSNDKNNNYFYLLLLVLGITYFICCILFESLNQPFIILSVIPISFIGVFLTFYLFDLNFDQGGLASFVLLSGLTVNASIFIVNDFNRLKKEFPKLDTKVLYLEAFKQKIFPIVLTVVSTILGFVPFVKDGQNEVFWFALGAGTIGGLLFSLIGILFFLPIFTLKPTKF